MTKAIAEPTRAPTRDEDTTAPAASGVSDAAHEAASRLVGEPKASAQEAGQQWQVGGWQA